MLTELSYPLLKNIDSNFMRLITRYSTEKTWYCAVYNLNENHSFETRI